MAYGIPPKTLHTRPEGRRVFTHGENVAARRDPNGLPHEFNAPTPARYGRGPRYGDPEGLQHRETLRERPSVRENPSVLSKGVRGHGKDGRGGRYAGGSEFVHSSTGSQPGYVHESGAPPSLPVSRHWGGPAIKHVEQVGWLNGKFTPASHPNAERKLGTDRFFPHGPLRPEGLMHDASGGAHGRKSTPPPSGNHGGETRGLGHLNHPRDFNLGTASRVQDTDHAFKKR